MHCRIIIMISVVLMASSCTTRSHSSVDPANSSIEDNLYIWFEEAKAIVAEKREVDFSNLTFKTATVDEFKQLSLQYYRLYYWDNPQKQRYIQTEAFQSHLHNFSNELHGAYFPFIKTILVDIENLRLYAEEMSDYYGVPQREFVMALLIHELIHAADDIEFDLVSINRRHIGDYLGVEMVIEGHAQLQTEQYCAMAGCSKAAAIEINKATIPDVVDDTSSFQYGRAQNYYLKYGQGYEFLKALYERGPLLVKQALRHPPGSIPEFFDSASFPNIKRQQRRGRIFEILNSLEFDESSLVPVAKPKYTDLVLPITATARKKKMVNLIHRDVVKGAILFFDLKSESPILYIELTEVHDSASARSFANILHRNIHAKVELEPTATDTNIFGMMRPHESGWSTAISKVDENGGNSFWIRSVYQHDAYYVYISSIDSQSLHLDAIYSITSLLKERK